VKPNPARPLVAALTITQTAGYGVLFYAFSVTLMPLAEQLHTTATVIAGALTVSLLVSALAAVPVGRWLDRHGGRGLMTLGAALGAVAVLAWSQVDTVVQLYLVFVLIGLSSAMVLYEAAFTVLVRQVDPARRANALLTITFVAGFSPTLFLPLGGLLVRHLGWRTALVLLAVGYAIVVVPLHARFVPVPVPNAGTVDAARSAATGAALRDWGFWFIVVAFVGHGLVVWTVAVHVVAILVSLGHPAPVAAGIAGLLGLLSVAGRVLVTRASTRFRMGPMTASIFVVQALAQLALPLVGSTLTGAVICTVVFGLGYGVGTIARPALLAERYGTVSFGTIAGVLNFPVNVAKAVGPLTAAVLYTATGSYAAVCWAIAATSAIAAAMLAVTPAPMWPVDVEGSHVVEKRA
jgi:predicted MFS family arabinose efflux permease